MSATTRSTAAALAVGLLVGLSWAIVRSPGHGPPPGPPRALPTPVTAHLPAPRAGVLLVAWTPRPIDPAATERLRDSPTIESVAPVRREEVPVVAVADRGTTRLAAQDGAHVPVDVVAIEPDTYVTVVPAGSMTTVTNLRDGDALLGASTAQRWRVGPGATVRLSMGDPLRVAAVVDDDEIGGAELAVTAGTGRTLGVVAVRYVLVRAPERASAQATLRDALGAGLRVRAPGETPFLRDADAVPPLATVKSRFGELSVRTVGPERFVIDPAWVATNIVTMDVPVLGRTACHRAVMPALVAAMTELDRAGLAWLVDASAPHDCWAPRLIGQASDGNRRLSRHAWGIAIDLNPHRNLPGSAPVQAPELVTILQRHGFTWGGDWLRPEGAYFEFVTGTG